MQQQLPKKQFKYVQLSGLPSTCDMALAHTVHMHGQTKFGQQHGMQPLPLVSWKQQYPLFQVSGVPPSGVSPSEDSLVCWFDTATVDILFRLGMRSRITSTDLR